MIDGPDIKEPAKPIEREMNFVVGFPCCTVVSVLELYNHSEYQKLKHFQSTKTYHVDK